MSLLPGFSAMTHVKPAYRSLRAEAPRIRRFSAEDGERANVIEFESEEAVGALRDYAFQPELARVVQNWLGVSARSCECSRIHITLVNCPRISPALFASVWTLTYHSPASSCCSCCSDSVALPSNGLLADGAFVKMGMTTPAFLP